VKLRRLEIHNYKSLRHVAVEPAPLSVFVGPNAAGKSNLADALDFLGHVYLWDLEGAVKRKGGYENICFRKTARSSAAIRFRVVLESEDPVFDHTFELRTRSQSIDSPFYIAAEELVIRFTNPEDQLRITRKAGQQIDIGLNGLRHTFLGTLAEPKTKKILSSIAETETLPAALKLFSPLKEFLHFMASLRVFQLSPRHCRESGVPTPEPGLDRFGSNLPAVIDYLKSNVPEAFEELENAVRCVMPALESITTAFTHTKTLALFLKEVGVKQPWTAEDISDGTIQAIALLAATFDPRIPLLVLEEPENSVHPWAIRNFVQAFRAASAKKQIFLTTHSPILIDQIQIEELWVVQRPGLETKITPVLELDPALKQAWGHGRFTLSEYLDSGALPAAVPAPGA
jgi:predicted ATPase